MYEEETMQWEVVFFFSLSILFIQGFLIIRKFMLLLKMIKISCET